MYKLVSFFILLAFASGVNASSHERTVTSVVKKAIKTLAAATDTTIQKVCLDDYTLERVVRRHTLKQFGGGLEPYAVADFLGIGIGAWALAGYDLPQDVRNILSQYKEGKHWYWAEQQGWVFSGQVFQALDNFAGVRLSQEDADVLLKLVIAQHIVDVCAKGREKQKCQDILQGSTFSSSHQLRIYRFIIDSEVRATTEWFQDLYADKAQVPKELKHAWGNLHWILGDIREKYSTYDLATVQQRLVDLEKVKRGFCYQSQSVHADFQQKKILPSDRLASSALNTVSRGLDAHFGIGWRYKEAAESLAAAWKNKLAADAARPDSASAVVVPAVSAEGPAGAGSGAGWAGSGVVGADAPGMPPRPVLSGASLAMRDQLHSDLESLHRFTSMINQESVAHELNELRKSVLSARSVAELQLCRTALDDYLAKHETQESVKNSMRRWMQSHPHWQIPEAWRGCPYVQDIFNQVQRERQAPSVQTPSPVLEGAAPAERVLPLPSFRPAVLDNAGFISNAFAGDMAAVALPSQRSPLPVSPPAVSPTQPDGGPAPATTALPSVVPDEDSRPATPSTPLAPVHTSGSAVPSVVPHGQPELADESVQPAPVSPPAVSLTQPDGDSRPANPSTPLAPVHTSGSAVPSVVPHGQPELADESVQPAPAPQPASAPQPAKKTHRQLSTPQLQKHDTTLARGVQYAGGALTVGVLGYLLAQVLKDRDSRAVVARAFQKLAGKKVAPLTFRQQRAAKRLQRDGGIAGVGSVLGIAALLGGWSLRKQKRVA